jgi:hypothetical protein
LDAALLAVVLAFGADSPDREAGRASWFGASSAFSTGARRFSVEGAKATGSMTTAVGSMDGSSARTGLNGRDSA